MTTSLTGRARRRDPRSLVTAALVVGSVGFLVWTLSPWVWFIDTTPTGGDMGAHVWSPAFLRDELLPSLRLTGWSPDWYAGFPAFTFYMIIPSLAIVILNVGIETGVGPFTLDLDTYAFIGLVLGVAEAARRLRVAPVTRIGAAAAAGVVSIALSWRWDGHRFDPGRILPWSPIEPFTYNDDSIDLALATLVLPAAVGSIAWHLARSRGRWRGPLTAAAVLATLLVVPVPYGVAMKLVAVSGIVTLPLAAYGAGRLARVAYPGPALMAVATLPFLYDRSFNIYGGNIMSTMAGEFAYSMGLSIAVLYVGVAARGMQTGRHRALAGGLLALAGLTHLFAAFFALVATVALFLVRPGNRELSWLTVAAPLAGLLSAFWVLPFYWNSPYLNDMGWGKERDYVAALWSRGGNFGGQTFLVNEPPLQLFVVLAVIGAVVCAIRRVRLGIALSLVAIAFAVAFLLLPESRLWNVRILPFYYLSVYLVAAIGVAEGFRVVADHLRTPDAIRAGRPTWTAGIPAAVVALVLIAVLAFPLRAVPFADTYADGDRTEYGYERPWRLGSSELNLGPGWMRYNFEGYEMKAAADEYRHLIATMERIGQDERYGCGQSLWEYEGDRLGSYGTPMAPMLLPHWTDGCIGSMEGLYFEASATTPYHFLLQSELSEGPSRAMREMPYSSLDVARGVEGLRTMGVRYYMAVSEAAVAQARATAGLTEIATSGPWVIFLVDDQDVVTGLDHLPVVVDGVDTGGEEWLVPSVAWWEAGHDTPHLAADGPADWPRSSLDDLEASDPALVAARDADDRVAEMRRLAELAPEWLPRVDAEVAVVDDVELDTDRISFTVDRVGTPVLVRASYFPNWRVSGAEGPYRVSPNLMVVVPTDTTVTLTYGRSPIEIASMGLTLVGVVGALAWTRLPVGSRRRRLWDLGAPVVRLPDSIELADVAQAGRIDLATIDALAARLDRLRRRAWAWLGVGLALVTLSTAALIAVRAGSGDLVPGGDKPLASVLVLGPGVMGVLIAVFVAAPALFETWRAERETLGLARRLARPDDELGAAEQPGSGPVP